MSEGQNVSTENYLLPTVMETGGHAGTIKIDKDIIIAVDCVINILGIPGAIIIIAVMRLSKLKSMPRSILYVSLAVINLSFCVYKVFTIIWLLALAEAFGQTSNIDCKIDKFFVMFLVHMDAWLLISLTGERVIGIIKPLKVATIVTRARVKVILAVMITFFIVWDVELSASSSIVIQSTNSTKSKAFCKRVNYYNVSKNVLSFKDTLGNMLFTFIAFAIILAMNIMLSVQLCRMKEARAELGATGRGIQNEAYKITGMVMAASLGFLALTSPVIIYVTTGTRNKNDPIAMILKTIYHANPAANFYIYFLSGSLFRQEVKKLFSPSCCIKELGPTKHRSTSFTMTTSVSTINDGFQNNKS